ncbi:hypothetical protein FQN50_005982 [Emmonsiellopsis sp. PD_5]|nr:hypothetical protein FQN50_005982 [Emmonsiellopsis sp. PD_5]
MLFSLYASTALLAGLATALPTANPEAQYNRGGYYPQKPPKHTPHTVPGKAFDRFVVIWNENTDIEDAQSDPNFNSLAARGIRLNNYFAVTHPSEPNYVSAVSGEYFGMDNDDNNAIPSNVSTIVDLLEDKGISWGEYQEHMPYTGFEGFEYRNKEGKNDYVRKHNPLVIYDSVAEKKDRLANIKNFTEFYKDLEANKLPQWMFITPNMTNDGHDTDYKVAGAWTKRFLEPLLDNPNFMQNTLVVVSWDEGGTYTHRNQVDTILLGDAVPEELRGTTDDNFYTHCMFPFLQLAKFYPRNGKINGDKDKYQDPNVIIDSEISTIEANWNLHTLGRYDVGANVFSLVGEKTGDEIRQPEKDLDDIYLNYSYPGIENNVRRAPMPVPNTELVRNGRTVLPLVKEVWGALQGETEYEDRVDVPSGWGV